jgi:hypothetical protein
MAHRVVHRRNRRRNGKCLPDSLRQTQQPDKKGGQDGIGRGGRTQGLPPVHHRNSSPQSYCRHPYETARRTHRFSGPPSSGHGDLPLSYGGDDDATLPHPARYPGRPGSRSQPSRQEKATGKRPEHWTYYTDEPTTDNETKSERHHRSTV